MDEKTTYWASVLLAAGALLLLIINMSLISSNRTTQEEIQQRQTNIGNAIQLSQLNTGLVNALANAAITNPPDAEARSLLAAQGITINPAAKAAAPKAEENKQPVAKEAKKKPSTSDDE